MKYDFITIGGAVKDTFFVTNKDCLIKTNDPLRERLICFEYGIKIIPEKVYFAFGGGALNSAVSFSRLGFKVGTILSLGLDETSKEIKEHISKEKVKGLKLNPCKGKASGKSFFVVDEKGDHVAYLYRGANDELKIKDWSWLNQTNSIYLTSLTGKADLLTQKIIGNAWKKKVSILWNPGTVQLEQGYQKLNGLLSKIDILILNKDEARELVLTKSKKLDITNIKAVLQEIGNWIGKVVIITDGKNGAYAYDKSKIYYVKSPKKQVVDTTGAGDSFGSTFAGGLAISKDIKKALAMAVINSTSVVSHYGAQEGLLKLRTIKKYIDQVKVSAINQEKKKICKK